MINLFILNKFSMKKIYPKIYRKTRLGETLEKTLEEMIKNNLIDKELSY